jgi:3-deoxy-7-phosphoheptulonate synthase
MTLGAVACGADGILIEVHPNPTEALCDGPQSLSPEKFKNLMQSLAPVAKAVNRELNLNDQ